MKPLKRSHCSRETYFEMFLFGILLVSVLSKCAVAISNKNKSQDFSEMLLDLSNIAIQGRQRQPYQQYYPQVEQYPSYYQHYKPQKYQYGTSFPGTYPSNEISNSVYQHYSPPQFSYPKPPYQRPPFIEKTQQSVMDALFSIAQNDDLQCVPKLLCEVTSGGLTGRQEGFNLPINVNLESLTTFLSGLNSANMSPVLHFGKAAILGFAAKGHSRSCQYSYPECPSDPDKLIQYLNNHNGGFFRFFQGLNPFYPNTYPQNYAHYFNGYRPGYFGKSALAEKRIQNRPSDFTNNDFDRDTYYKDIKTVSLPQFSFKTPISYETVGAHRVLFPSNEEGNRHFAISGAKTLKFPSEDTVDPYRRGKKLQFDTYLNNNNENYLDYQKPLPNHVPTRNIFPDRTGTGELKLDLDDLEQNYQQSLAYDFDQYNQLLYDSFPNDGSYRPSRLSFPNK